VNSTYGRLLSQLLSSFNTLALNMSSRIWFTLLIWPSVWGWQVELKFNFVSLIYVSSPKILMWSEFLRHTLLNWKICEENSFFDGIINHLGLVWKHWIGNPGVVSTDGGARCTLHPGEGAPARGAQTCWPLEARGNSSHFYTSLLSFKIWKNKKNSLKIQ
jgi:hypothetical protein